MHKVGLAAIGVASLITLLLGLLAIGAFRFAYDGSFYPFTLPSLVLNVLCVLLSLLGLLSSRMVKRAFWVTVACGCFAFAAYLYAITLWPRGDDGPGMFWFLFVGAGSILVSMISLLMLVLGITVERRAKSDT